MTVTAKEVRSKTTKAIELNGAGLFDVHRWSDYPEVNHVVDAIFDEIKGLRQSKEKRIREPEKVKKHLKVVILDLWAANKLALNPFRAISKNKKSYQIKSRYRRIHLKYDYLMLVINDLKELGYLEQDIGFKDRQTGKGRMTRIKATEKLINKILFPEYGVDKVVASKGLISIASRNDDEETIILRDNRKKNIDYEDTDATNRMRENLKLINDKIANTRISLDISDEQFEKLEAQIGTEDKPRIIDFSRTKLCRIFNNSSFELGGRFYGGWWQSIPRSYRKSIEINHKHTAELDYSGHHIRILYARENLEPPDEPYDIEGFDRDNQKEALLIILNASTKSKAIRAILDKGIKDAEPLIEALIKRHNPIHKYFYSGEGLKLQYLDSMIAEQVMLTMLKHGATVLPVHDSFIVRSSYEEELKEIMIQLFEDIFGKVAKIKPKITSYEETQKKKRKNEQLTGIVEKFVTDDLNELFQFRNKHKKKYNIWGYS